MRRNIRLSAQADSNTYSSKGNSAGRKNKFQLSQCREFSNTACTRCYSMFCFFLNLEKSIWVFFKNKKLSSLLNFMSQWTPVIRDLINSAA